MATPVLTRPAGLGLRRGLQCAALLAAVLVPFQTRLPIGVELAFLIVPVLVAGVLGGWLPVVVTAGTGALILAEVIPPYWSLRVDGDERLAFGFYLAVAFAAGTAVARGAAHQRRTALAARAIAADHPVFQRRARRPVPDLPLRPLGAFFGHHKCGTSWVGDTLAALCAELGWSNWSVDNAGPFLESGMERWAFDNRIDVVTYTNADIRYVPDRADLRAVHVIRDPRDVCVSAYFSHLNSHPTSAWPQLANFRDRLRAVDMEEGLRLEIEFLSPVFEAMRAWDYHRPTILELRFEDLTDDPEAGFLQIAEFLCMVDGQARHREACPAGEKLRRRFHLPPSSSLSPAVVAGIVHAHRFEVKSGGRPRGVADPSSHYRAGVPGDWQQYLTPDHLALLDDTYPELLARTGYGA